MPTANMPLIDKRMLQYGEAPTNQAHGLVLLANGFKRTMDELGYKNVYDFLPKSSLETTIKEDDMISVLTGGLINEKQFVETNNPEMIRRVGSGLDDLVTALTSANKDFVSFLNESDSNSDLMKIMAAYVHRRGRIGTQMYDKFNLHKKFGRMIGVDPEKMGILNFDIHGAYIQIINKFPIIRNLNEMMKHITNTNQTHSENIANSFVSLMKKKGKELSRINPHLGGESFLEQHLKFFDPTYHFYERAKIGDYNYLNDRFTEYLMDAGVKDFHDSDIEDVAAAQMRQQVFKVTFDTAKEIWNLNYGANLTQRMLRGEFDTDNPITWKDVPDDGNTVLGLQKGHMRRVREFYDTSKDYIRGNEDEVSSAKKAFKDLINKFSPDDEANQPEIRAFYLPFQMSDEDRAKYEEAMINHRAVRNSDEETPYVSSIMKFLDERKTDGDPDFDKTTNMRTAFFQRIEQLMLGTNSFTRSMFAEAARGYLTKLTDQDHTKINQADIDGIRKYIHNVEVASKPSKDLSYGKERVKQLMRLSFVFPAAMISRAASGVRNLVAAGMGLFNGDWHGYAWNTDFNKALKSGQTEIGSQGWIASYVDKAVEEGYILPGLASAFFDSAKFIEVQARNTGVSEGKYLESFLTRIEGSLSKFADWSVNGYFLKNIPWFYKIFTVPGSERELRGSLKNFMFQALNADVSMMINLRQSDATDIDYKLKGLIDLSGSEYETGLQEVKVLVDRQLDIAKKNNNEDMRKQYEALARTIGTGELDKIKSATANFNRWANDTTGKFAEGELRQLTDISARQFKAIIDEQLGDFSPAGKPFIENLYLKDADTYHDIMLGGILKAASYFNVVTRTSSKAFLSGGHMVASSMFHKTGKEAAGWEEGLRGMVNFENGGGSATVSVGLGLILAMYGLTAGLFKKNTMIGSALSMNPISGYVPPIRLAGQEAIHIFGILSGMGVSVPQEIREQVYKDNIRWAAGAIAGKTASQLYAETYIDGRSANPVEWFTELAMDIWDLPDLVSHGMTNIRMDKDFDKYYDWKRSFNNAFVPVNHLAPVYLAQKSFETLVELNAPKDERGFRIMSQNIQRIMSNWFGLSVWTQINENNVKRPVLREQRAESRVNMVDNLLVSPTYSEPWARTPRRRLENLQRDLNRDLERTRRMR